MDNFYPRSPCGERPAKNTSMAGRITLFLSTLSLRRATVQVVMEEDMILISIHALLAESDAYLAESGPESENISIHALLAESDSAWVPEFPQLYISIHALLAESDRFNRNITNGERYFYPRSPCGERRLFNSLNLPYHIFLSTLSLRRATVIASRVYEGNRISIHALLAESDSPEPETTPSE